MNKLIPITLVTSLTLAGCGVPSDVVPVGPDSYMVSATALGVIASQAPIGAARAASNYCEKQGRHMVIRRIDNAALVGGPVSNTMVFSCVTGNDPEYRRPNLRHEPDVVIEDKETWR
jgi:putative hemolysin